MRFAVLGSDEFFQRLKYTSQEQEWVVAASLEAAVQDGNPDAIFVEQAHDISSFQPQCCLFVASLTPITNDSWTRFNPWPGFLENKVWEIAGRVDQGAQAVLAAMGKDSVLCADEAGFITPRILSLIINEAYLALEDGVSTKEEIDIAMKLGTSYPNGPFEWAEKIGEKNIVQLLYTLAESDARYTPASSLIQKADLI